MASVGEEFPREQARCRRLILDYIALPNGAGALGARMIEAVLQGADRSIASGDPKKIARDLKLMKEYQWEFEKRPNGIPVPSEEIDASLAPAFASERPGLARLLEWARAKLAEESAEMREYPERGRDAFEECVDEIEQAIAAIAPPSIAEDLRAPEPGAFEGAELVPAPPSAEFASLSRLARELWDEGDDIDRLVAVGFVAHTGVGTPDEDFEITELGRKAGLK